MIYLLERLDNVASEIYEMKHMFVYRRFVIRAPSKAEAREIAANESGDTGWRKPSFASCKKIAAAGKAMLILEQIYNKDTA